MTCLEWQFGVLLRSKSLDLGERKRWRDFKNLNPTRIPWFIETLMALGFWDFRDFGPLDEGDNDELLLINTKKQNQWRKEIKNTYIFGAQG